MKSSMLAVALGLFLVLLSNSYLRVFHNTVAQCVLGQVNLTHNTLNLTYDQGLLTPSGVVIDQSVVPNRLYVADYDNSRVLTWADASAFISGAPTDRVIGQPDFTTVGCNFGGLSASSMCNPNGVAVDASGSLYVSDFSNSRVLVYFTPFSDKVADVVLGQPI